MIHSQKMEAIGTLAGGIAHDFNNILTSILGFSSLIKMKATNDHQFHIWANTIENAAVRAKKLTSQLLGFTGRGMGHITLLDINKLVTKVKGMILQDIPSFTEIGTELDDRKIVVEGDLSQLENCLIHLCRNAGESIDSGGKITLKTSTACLKSDEVPDLLHDEEQYFASIEIADTGEGMSEEILRRIFDPFFTTKKTEGNTGLGLSLVYGIIKNHGGIIKTESMSGRGSTFTVYLPLAEVSEMSPVNINEEKVKPKIKGGFETILVIDDERDIRELTVFQLEKLGYSVLSAPDGKAGVELFRNRRKEIDLVILDLIMPGWDGKETFRRLIEISPSIRILLFSGYSIDGEAGRLLKSGAKGFLQKPCSLSEMDMEIRQILDSDDSFDSAQLPDVTGIINDRSDI